MGGNGGGGLPEDLDLDNFLDSYLVQLQSDKNAPQQLVQPLQAIPPMQAPMSGTDNLLLGLLGNGGMNLAALQGLQGGGGMPGAAMLNPYMGLPQQQQQLLQQQQGLAGLAGMNMGLGGQMGMPAGMPPGMQNPPKAQPPSTTASGRPRRAAAVHNPHLSAAEVATATRSGGLSRPSGDDSDALSRWAHGGACMSCVGRVHACGGEAAWAAN